MTSSGPPNDRHADVAAQGREYHPTNLNATRLVLLVYNDEPTHPEIVRDDLGVVLDKAGYDFVFISAEDVA